MKTGDLQAELDQSKAELAQALSQCAYLRMELQHANLQQMPYTMRDTQDAVDDAMMRSKMRSMTFTHSTHNDSPGLLAPPHASTVPGTLEESVLFAYARAVYAEEQTTGGAGP